ncbi:MAG TPA: molybdopterin-dependent oxidoreductase [Euzebyales bacterium]|nr:molybdopterin-dependent oxidoreductase [Euzebyales bacterium]
MATVTEDDVEEQRSTAATPQWPAALAGVLAALAALAGGELVAALVPGARSPVTSIGAVVIDLAPPALKDAAIDLLGTADKPVLIGTVHTVLLVAAAATGILAAQRWWAGVAGVTLLGVVAMSAALADTAVSGVAALLPSVVATIVGIGTLWWLTHAVRDWTDPADDEQRRTFLRAAAMAGGATVVAGGLGRFLISQAEAATAPSTATLPRADEPLPALPADASLEVEGITPFVTPNDDFYRIDTALRIPNVDVEDWSLQVTGMVDNPLELTFDQLQRYEIVEADVTLACVSNEVGGDLVDNARWRGVRLADVLADARVRPGADQLVGRAVDGFTTGAPLEVVTGGRDALIAIGMNGEPLPRKHGYPARLVVPGLYGYVSATKWLAELELTTFDAFDAYWVPRGWAERAPIKTQARIDVPRPLDTIAPGPTAVAGVAWAQTRGISKVEVRVDDGPWQEARLSEEVGADTWRQWVYEWDATPGSHDLRVRATDGTGRTQTAERQPPRPDGATGRHGIVVTVSEG